LTYSTEYQARIELAKKQLLEKEEQTRKQQEQMAEAHKNAGACVRNNSTIDYRTRGMVLDASAALLTVHVWL